MDLYFLNGLAQSTRRTYDSAKRRYLSFCQKTNLTPLPAGEHQLCLFVAFLAQEHLAHKTIKGYLSAVRHLHIAAGVPDPKVGNMTRLEQVLRGIKSLQAKEHRQGRVRLPMTVDIMLKLYRFWRLGRSYDGTMLWAASALCFFGFLRSGEVTIPSKEEYDEGAHLAMEDVSVDSLKEPKMLKVRIKASKTDPFRQGVDVFVGITGSELCPVTAVLAYMVIRQPGPGPLFKFENGSPLTQTAFVDRLRKALSRVGMDSSKYAGHSFRANAATTAAKLGISDSTIKMLGRWQSSAYQLYIKTPREQLAKVSCCLVQGL